MSQKLSKVKPEIAASLRERLLNGVLQGVVNFFQENPNKIPLSLGGASDCYSTITFRGSITEYLEQYNSLNGIERIEVSGPKVGSGVYDTSSIIKQDELKSFMEIIQKQKIKEISFHLSVKLQKRGKCELALSESADLTDGIISSAL